MKATKRVINEGYQEFGMENTLGRQVFWKMALCEEQ